LRPNYTLLNRVEPVVLPRASFTLIEKRHAKTLSKYNLGFADLFNGPEETRKKVVGQSLDAGTAAVLDETEQVFETQLEKLRASLTAVDPTLADALKGGREKDSLSTQQPAHPFHQQPQQARRELPRSRSNGSSPCSIRTKACRSARSISATLPRATATS
jgi:uncharacterized protein YllA (UPF0747 family)